VTLGPTPTFAFECQWDDRIFIKPRTEEEYEDSRNMGGGFMPQYCMTANITFLDFKKAPYSVVKIYFPVSYIIDV
jgi:hypothetical protein